jgi:hypothetical protein
MKKLALFLSGLVMLLGMSSATATDSSTPSPLGSTALINEEQAIEVAIQAALLKGVPEDWFGGDVVARFSAGKWIVRFSAKPDPIDGSLRVGNHFGVYVSADGSQTTLIPGF